MNTGAEVLGRRNRATGFSRSYRPAPVTVTGSCLSVDDHNGAAGRYTGGANASVPGDNP